MPTMFGRRPLLRLSSHPAHTQDRTNKHQNATITQLCQPRSRRSNCRHRQHLYCLHAMSQLRVGLTVLTSFPGSMQDPDTCTYSYSRTLNSKFPIPRSVVSQSIEYTRQVLSMSAKQPRRLIIISSYPVLVFMVLRLSRTPG